LIDVNVENNVEVGGKYKNNNLEVDVCDDNNLEVGLI